MLADQKQFEKIEEILRAQGDIEAFEQESGKILGRMMITLGKVPKNMKIEENEGDFVFVGSFDFYDSEIGIVINPKTKHVEGGLWVTKQKESADAPDKAWINFFIQKLLESFDEDGSFGVPIYSFINDTSDMTIIPSKDKPHKEKNI